MDEIKKTARERGLRKGLSYAGELLPAEAHKLMQGGAKLVDVRTKPELLYVGKVPGSLAVEWQTYPGSRDGKFRFPAGSGLLDMVSTLSFLAACTRDVRLERALDVHRGQATPLNVSLRGEQQ